MDQKYSCWIFQKRRTKFGPSDQKQKKSKGQNNSRENAEKRPKNRRYFDFIANKSTTLAARTRLPGACNSNAEKSAISEKSVKNRRFFPIFPRFFCRRFFHSKIFSSTTENRFFAEKSAEKSDFFVLGYNQIALALEDQEKTIFTCLYGTFVFRRMPFGLCNALATFQRCMMSMFSDLVEEAIEIFMDDFSVYGSSFEHCLKKLKTVLQRCQDKNLDLN